MKTFELLYTRTHHHDELLLKIELSAFNADHAKQTLRITYPDARIYRTVGAAS